MGRYRRRATANSRVRLGTRCKICEYATSSLLECCFYVGGDGSAGLQGWGKRDVTEKNPPTSGIVCHDPISENPETAPPGFEPVSNWWEASSQTPTHLSLLIKQGKQFSSLADDGAALRQRTTDISVRHTNVCQIWLLPHLKIHKIHTRSHVEKEPAPKEISEIDPNRIVCWETRKENCVFEPLASRALFSERRARDHTDTSCGGIQHLGPLQPASITSIHYSLLVNAFNSPTHQSHPSLHRCSQSKDFTSTGHSLQLEALLTRSFVVFAHLSLNAAKSFELVKLPDCSPGGPSLHKGKLHHSWVYRESDAKFGQRSRSQEHASRNRLIAVGRLWLAFVSRRPINRTACLCHGGVVVRLLVSHLGAPGSIPGGVTTGFSHVGIVSDDALVSGFSMGMFSFARPCSLSLLHTHLASSSSCADRIHLPSACRQWLHIRRDAVSLADVRRITITSKSTGTVYFADDSSGLPAALPAHTWLDYSPPTEANKVRFPAGPPPRIFACGNSAGGFSRGSLVSSALAFRRLSILTSLHMPANFRTRKHHHVDNGSQRRDASPNKGKQLADTGWRTMRKGSTRPSMAKKCVARHQPSSLALFSQTSPTAANQLTPPTSAVLHEHSTSFGKFGNKCRMNDTVVDQAHCFMTAKKKKVEYRDMLTTTTTTGMRRFPSCKQREACLQMHASTLTRSMRKCMQKFICSDMRCSTTYGILELAYHGTIGGHCGRADSAVNRHRRTAAANKQGEVAWCSGVGSLGRRLTWRSSDTMRVKRGECGAEPEYKGGRNGRSTRKPADQRHQTDCHHALKSPTYFEAIVAERLACSPPTKAIRVQSPAGSLRIFACRNCAGR
ncbi:hypothetical protein PR048_015658 [Dryococelus australis]|uniref:Uncharacterized protein n=1 Tax=Dryococelus australis TaxID=614101 RepID=A0ABQ9HHK2_9NEOP|nr:hypothetical protein PR048_015658 [Dryococelus australis]